MWMTSYSIENAKISNEDCKLWLPTDVAHGIVQEHRTRLTVKQGICLSVCYSHISRSVHTIYFTVSMCVTEDQRLRTSEFGAHDMLNINTC